MTLATKFNLDELVVAKRSGGKEETFTILHIRVIAVSGWTPSIEYRGLRSRGNYTPWYNEKFVSHFLGNPARDMITRKQPRVR